MTIRLCRGRRFFYLTKKDGRLHFELSQTLIQKPVLLEIALFFKKIPSLSLSSAMSTFVPFPDLAKVVTIRERIFTQPTKKPMCVLRISNEIYIKEILITFFDSLTFFTSKEKSFKL